ADVLHVPRQTLPVLGDLRAITGGRERVRPAPELLGAVHPAVDERELLARLGDVDAAVRGPLPFRCLVIAREARVVVIGPLRALAHGAELTDARDVGDDRVHGLRRGVHRDGVAVLVLREIHAPEHTVHVIGSMELATEVAGVLNRRLRPSLPPRPPGFPPSGKRPDGPFLTWRGAGG